MTGAEIALIALAALAVIGVVLFSGAQRLDRLHRRVVTSRATLETQLTRRAEAATDLVATGVLDPASAVIVAEAAWRAGMRANRLLGLDDVESLAATGPVATAALASGDPDSGLDRGAAESDLSDALREALGGTADQDRMAAAGAAEELTALRRTCYRVQLARRFHNDTVAAVGRLRGQPLVRLFRLAGRAALPAPFEMDDEVFAA